MKPARTDVLLAILVASAAVVIASAESHEDYWPTWRGPHADGVAPNGDPPVTWNEDENIKWKVKLPDSGESTPIIWGNRIFLQTAVPVQVEPDQFSEEHPKKDRHQQPRAAKNQVPWRFGVLCLDRKTGETLWDQTATTEIPHARHHATSSHSSYSAVTDGEHVWASFGSRGLYCFDVDGNRRWGVELPKMQLYGEYGEGSSAAVAGDNIFVVQDHLGDSALFAFDKLTGDLVWEVDRGTRNSAWSTPLIVQVDDSYQVVIAGNTSMDAYAASTGELIWTCAVSQTATVPTPVKGHGNVYYMCGHPGSSVMAIALGRTGDLSGTDAIQWEVTQGAPYVTSPLLYEDRFYFLKKYKGAISSYDAVTGEAVYVEESMNGMRGCYASPVAAAGRVYVADRRGTVTVLKQGDTFEVLATNRLDEGFDASPAIVGKELFLKGEHHLYCIAEP